MILNLDEAKQIDADITQDELDSLETTVRELTNNNFHHKSIRNNNLAFQEDNLIITSTESIGYRTGDTIEIVSTKFNDGLWIVEQVIDEHSLTVQVSDSRYLTTETSSGAFIAKVEYPADVRIALKEIIKYKSTMANKVGIKSESISRKSTTYFDVSAQDNIEGIPSSYWSFIKKHRRIRW